MSCLQWNNLHNDWEAVCFNRFVELWPVFLTLIWLLKSIFWMYSSGSYHSESWNPWSMMYNNAQPWPYISPDYPGEYYGPGGNYDYFPHGPPSSQAQTPSDLGYIPSSGPAGTPLGTMDHHHSGHHPSGESQCFGEMVPQHPSDSPSPEHSISADMSSAFTSISSLSANGYSSQPSSEMSEGTVW